MTARFISYFAFLLFAGTFCNAQSADEHHGTTGTKVRYDNFSPGEKPLAPAKPARIYERAPSNAPMTELQEKVDALYIKGWNARVHDKFAKSENYYLEALKIIGLENYYEFHRTSNRENGFFELISWGRAASNNYQGAMDACDSMLKYEPEKTKDALYKKAEYKEKLEATKK